MIAPQPRRFQLLRELFPYLYYVRLLNLITWQECGRRRIYGVMWTHGYYAAMCDTHFLKKNTILGKKSTAPDYQVRAVAVK